MMDMLIENKKSVISFVLGLVVMGLIWAIVGSSSRGINQSVVLTPVEIQQRMAESRASALSYSGTIAARSGAILHSGSSFRPTTGMERILPWATAVTFIETAPVQKIELSSGLTIKLIMKNGPSFTATQPTKDAYLVPLKKAKSKIEIVK